jgi:fermentation-respiration switch protein FrsA (DUF1100 family)
MTVLLWVGIGLTVILVLLLMIQGIGHVLLYPSVKKFAELENGSREMEDVEFFAEDGTRLHGWWFPHPEAKGAMLICHGNGGNISHRMWMAEDLNDIPLHLFIFDYRGYGKSRSITSEKGTGRDVKAAWEVVHEKLGRPENPPILLYGRSLGGAVALQLPPACEVRGVVLESTFTSILEIGIRQYPWLLPKWTLRNPYRSDLRIAAVEVPVLSAHSPTDEVVPFEMGERLYQKVPNPWGFCVLSGAHDEAGWQTSPEYARRLREFIQELILSG